MFADYKATALLQSSSYFVSSDGCLHVLGDMTSDAGVSDYGPVVECLTSWGHTKDVLDLANSWLRALLNGEKSSR